MSTGHLVENLNINRNNIEGSKIQKERTQNAPKQQGWFVQVFSNLFQKGGGRGGPLGLDQVSCVSLDQDSLVRLGQFSLVQDRLGLEFSEKNS